MADNTTLPGGDVIRDVDNGSLVKTQVFLFNQGTPAAESLVSPTSSLYVRANSKRQSAIVHRTITSVDRLTAPTIPTTVTDVTSGGSLAQGTAYFLAAVAGNSWGVTTPGAIGTVTTAASGGSVHAIKGTLAQVTNAVYYDIFMSTSSTAPTWVARITETQRANANGVVVTAVGTAGAGSSLGAGVIQVNLIGTGQALTAQNFITNNALTPDLIAAVPAIVDCTGFSGVHVKAVLSLTDLRTAPAVTLVPFSQNENDSSWDAMLPVPLALLLAEGQQLRQDFDLKIDGGKFLIACSTLTGQGASLVVTMEPY